MKGGTQSTQVFIQRVFTEHQLLPTLCRVPRTDQWTLQEGRKEGSGGVGREVERKETKLLPSVSLQSSQRARLEILKQGSTRLVSNGEDGQEGRERARNEASRGDLPLVPGSALRGSNISAGQAT